MGCGIMELDHTSFEWTLTYDEYDFVIDGTLEIEIDGRIVSGNPGDIIYIPKNIPGIPVSQFPRTLWNSGRLSRRTVLMSGYVQPPLWSLSVLPLMCLASMTTAPVFSP